MIVIISGLITRHAQLHNIQTDRRVEFQGRLELRIHRSVFVFLEEQFEKRWDS